MLIQVPAVQTYITKQVAQSFEEQWGTRVEVGKVNLTFFETATIEDIYVEDQTGDTLLYAEELKADIGLFALFDQTLVIDEIALENGYVNLYRHADSTRFNYEFIAESFASDTTQPADTSAGGFDFDLKQVRLEQFRFNFVDDSSEMEVRVRAPYFLTELETLGLEEEHIQINNIDIRDLDVLFRQIGPAMDTVAQVAEADTAEVLMLDSAWLNPTGFRYTVENFEMENSQIHFQTSEQEQEGKINFENVRLANLDLQLEDFYLGTDTLTADLQEFSFIERNSNFLLENLAFNVALQGSDVSARLEEFITANSRLTDAVIIENLDITAGDDMLAQLEARAEVEDAVISMKDAAYFVDALDTLPNLRNQDILLNLDLEVANNKASIDQLEMRANDGLYVNARAFAENIDTPDQLTFDVQLRELTTSMAYIEGLSLVEGGLPDGASQAGNITIIAQAEGSMDDASLTARVNSGVGNLQANVIYKAPTENSFFVAGKIDANQFDLRPFAGDTSGLGMITLTTNIRARGRGEAIDVNQFSLLVESLEFNEYTYENLAVEGHFIDSTLEVATAYEDQFLNFDLLVKSDLKDSLPLLIAEGTIDEANLFRLNLMEDSIIVSTALSAEVRGQTPDEIQGFFKLQDTEIIRGAKSYTMDSLLLASNSLPGNRREVVLETDFMSANLSGEFTFEELPTAIDQWIHYYSSAYEIDETAPPISQEVELDMIIREEPVIVKAFVPELDITLPLTIEASLETASRSFDLDIDAPGIVYDSVSIEDITVQAETEERILSFQLQIEEINVGETYDIPLVQLGGRWEQDSLHFDMALAPVTDSTHLMMGGAVTFPGDTISLELDQTDVAINGKDYMLADNTIIQYAPDYLSIDNFTLQRQDQRISIFTQDADTDQPKLITEIREFQIAEFMDLAGMEDYGVAATLHGDVRIVDVASLQAIEAELAINDLIVDSIRAGDITIQADKVADNGRINTNISLEGPGNELDIFGYYNVEDSVDGFSLNMDMEQLQLEPWEPFVSEYMTDLQGSLQGQMEIEGNTSQPRIDGFLQFGQQTAFRLVTTGALYKLQEQRISFDPMEINFNELTLTDNLNNQLVVDGSIQHEYFENFFLDMEVNTDNFQVVNKDRSLEEPFFGTMFIETNLEINGPMEDIEVEGNLTVGDQTDLTLVLLEEERTLGDKEYINFVNTHAFIAEDTASAPIDSLEQLVDISGFSLTAILTITPESQFRVIIDPNTGDFLEVRGESELRITMNPLEGMNLQGTYTVSDGRYRLSFLEVIQKNFDIQEGSTVEFIGDPLDAILDMTAVYTTEASRYPLVENQTEFLSTAELSAAKQRKPVDVLLSMVGTIEDPEFTFNIIVPESDLSAGSAVSQALSEIKQDESKLFKQVFGLIVMNRFIPETPSLGGGGGAEQAINSRIDQSLSSFLTDQLNAVSQDYLGVSIEVDIDTRQTMTGQDAGFDQKDVGLQLGRTFFNDRLEVNVGGTTSVGDDGTTVAGGNTGNQFAGNFEILYHINERGNLNIKIFQRNERNLLTNEFIPQPGVALSYTKSFDQWREFVGEPKSRREILKSDGAIEVITEKEEDEEEEEEEKNEE